MSILRLRFAGDPILKKVCVPIDRIDKRLRIFLDDMAETMYAKNGIGIAAPQVGELIRAIVVDVDHKKRIDLINPVITFHEGSEIRPEGCLSCPNISGEVERATRVRVDYINRFGKKKFLEAEGLLARCLQHEIDHLSGKLFIDIAKSLSLEKKGSVINRSQFVKEIG